MDVLVKKKEDAMARSPRVLKPLIEEQIELAYHAGESFYKEAGVMLLEARESIKSDREWSAYVKSFRTPSHDVVSTKQAAEWMRLGRSERLGLGHSGVESARNDPRTAGRSSRTRNGGSRARGDQPEPRENKEKELADFRAQRRKERAEMLLLISAGYKELAKKRHPDVGGSHDAMVLVKRVRDVLIKYAEGWA